MLHQIWSKFTGHQGSNEYKEDAKRRRCAFCPGKREKLTQVKKICCWIHTVGWSYKVLCGSSWKCKEHTDKIMLSLRLNHFDPGSCVKNLLNFSFNLMIYAGESLSSSYAFLNIKNLPHDILSTIYFKSVSFLYSTTSILKILQWSISSKTFITKTNDPGRDEQSFFPSVCILGTHLCVYIHIHAYRQVLT